MKQTHCKHSNNSICPQIDTENKISFEIIDATVQKIKSYGKQFSGEDLSKDNMVTREKHVEKYQLLKWNSHEYNNKTFVRKNPTLKFILAKNPMAENLTANSQTSEILSLKVLPL